MAWAKPLKEYHTLDLIQELGIRGWDAYRSRECKKVNFSRVHNDVIDSYRRNLIIDELKEEIANALIPKLHVVQMPFQDQENVIKVVTGFVFIPLLEDELL
jgi:acetylglutamate synthase